MRGSITGLPIYQSPRAADMIALSKAAKALIACDQWLSENMFRGAGGEYLEREALQTKVREALSAILARKKAEDVT